MEVISGLSLLERFLVRNFMKHVSTQTCFNGKRKDDVVFDDLSLVMKTTNGLMPAVH
jgi:hypothetical protein